jgi:hypothetical protein
MALIFLLLPLLLFSLVVAGEVVARQRGKAEVLVFDLAVFAKAWAQFEHSSEGVELMLEPSLA